MLVVYFNSIKVRLEQATGERNETERTFQFHKGAIRTLRADAQTIREINFNSIKVRLELTYDDDHLPLFSYFNSIKVRLERFHEDVWMH